MPDLKRKKMLIVDDIPINRVILEDLFCDDYEIIEAENGLEALDYIQQYKDDLAIVALDIVMPKMDGFGVLQQMNDNGLIDSIPVIMITGENDDENIFMAYDLGAADLINKPFNPNIVIKRVNNVISLYSHKENLEMQLRLQKEQLEDQAKKLKISNQFVIDALSTTVEFRDSESGDHIKRIRSLTRHLLNAAKDDYGLNEDQIDMIVNASAMHDIGKIAIADAILLKPGRLTKEEFEIMKTHTIRGCEILQSLNYAQEEDYYNYCYEICRHHHERWDGNGYPDGLKGDEISIWAQATALADVYDALTSKRVYKDAYSHQKAVSMILDGECGIFNPQLLRYFNEVEQMLCQQVQESR